MKFRTSLGGTILLLGALILLSTTPADAAKKSVKVSKAGQACLKCHSVAGICAGVAAQFARQEWRGLLHLSQGGQGGP